MTRDRALRQLRELRRHGTGQFRLAAEGWREPWQTLVAIIMSARTRDEKTVGVAERLFGKYPSVRKLASAKFSDVAEIIYGVNFYRNKTKSVIGCAAVLVEEF